MAVKLDIPNLDDLIERYRRGESVKKLAAEAGITRSTFKSRLADAGIEIRGREGSVALALSVMSDQEREAHRARLRRGPEALRGRRLTETHLQALAVGRQRARQATPEERLVRAWLREQHLQAVPQVAVGAYSLDLGVGDAVAVEVQRTDCSATHKARVRLLQRLEHILDTGWHVGVILWGRDVPLDRAAAEHLGSWMQGLRRDPAIRGQYRVVWGDGKLLSAGEHQMNELARIWPTARRLRPWPGD